MATRWLKRLPLPHKPGQGNRGAVDLGHEQALEHHCVELGVRPPGQEAVQLDEELDIDVVGLGGSAGL